ncbi:hypothetical protein [Streptomyces viridosporus]|uniref:hypothetical protein n=1 Tax=Streptomyces viridosporus TaxID=67581 RepID=UPI00117C9D79|nr:hypothetical protein [Streptomyces viridosporus]
MTPDELHLRVFLVALPHALPIHTGATTSFVLPGDSPNLGSFTTRITADIEDTISIDGDYLVSLKFRQFDTSSNSDAQIHKSLAAAANEIHYLPSRDDSHLPNLEGHVTVVEMVTNSLEKIEEDDDPFDRCLDCLIDFYRGIRATRNLRIPAVSRHTLWPFAFTLLKDGSGEIIEDWQLMSLGHANLSGASASPPASFEQLQNVHVGISRLRDGDPWMLYAERKIDAEQAFFVNGDYSATVVNSAIACEVLLLTALTTGLWESGTTPQEAADILSVREIGPLISGDLARIWGGNWDRNSSAPVKAWREDIAKKRNKIVHEGYRASEDEAAAAHSAMLGLDEFVSARLLAKIAKFPRTCMMAFGEPGIKRRGLWTRRMRDFWDVQAQSEGNWIKTYTAWRKEVDELLP